MSKAEVTAHLKKFDKPQRDALQAVRLAIAELLPDAEEVIKYGIPTFAIEGKGVIGFDGYKNHNSIFPYSGSINQILKEDLSKYQQTKGSNVLLRERRWNLSSLPEVAWHLLPNRWG